MSELIYYVLSTDKAYREDLTEIANDNAPENMYHLSKELEIQLLNTYSITDKYTGFAAKTIAGRGAVDNNYKHLSTADLAVALSNGVGAATITITNTGTNFNATRPAGSLIIGAQTAYYNAITASGDNYVLTCADSNFTTADFTPSADYAEDLEVTTIEVPLIVDSAMDVTDKATGLLKLTNDGYNSNLQAEINGYEELEGGYQEFAIFEAGICIMRRRFPTRILAAIDDDGEQAPSPAGNFWNKTEIASLYVAINGSTMAQDVHLTGDISPAQITGNQDDYEPTGLATASTLRLDSDGNYNITGLAGGADGRLIIIHNVGANNLTLADEDASSTAANRFALTSDLILLPDAVALLQYDSTSERWRAISGGGSSGTVSEKLIELTGINFKTVQQNTVYTVPAGYKFKPEVGDLLTDTNTGGATPPTYKWVAGATDLMSAVVASSVAVGSFESEVLNAQIYWPATTIFKLEITSAGTSTTHTGRAILKGILIEA